jgi:hypothetical protein
MPTVSLRPGDPDCEYELVVSVQTPGGRGRGPWVSVAEVHRKGIHKSLGEFTGEGRSKASADQRAEQAARNGFRPPRDDS